MITIFTPTYNRAHTLPILFESLKRQGSKEFEWLIVDDGSTDDTATLVKSFREEKRFPIHYHIQKNQGKHIAINKGLVMAKGSYFLVIDSDDYLLNHAIEIILKYVEKLKNKKNFAGFTFIRFMERTPYDPTMYGNKEWVNDQPYNWEFPGEMGFCYKTEIAKKFPFPQFKGEKFCPESVVHRRIARNFDVLFTDNVLASGEYLEDGLSSKYNLLMEGSPRASLLSYAEKIEDSKENIDLRKQFAKNYWDLAIKIPRISWIERFRGIPLSLSIWYWKNRLLK